MLPVGCEGGPAARILHDGKGGSPVQRLPHHDHSTPNQLQGFEWVHPFAYQDARGGEEGGLGLAQQAAIEMGHIGLPRRCVANVGHGDLDCGSFGVVMGSGRARSSGR